MKRFKNYISEIDMTLQCHTELNPKLWNGEKLKPEVRKALIKFGETWAKYAKIPSDMILDIIMLGGNANYNYTPSSDIDVHIVVDRNKLGKDREQVDELLQFKKSMWTLTHDIKVFGYPLEPYAQDISTTYPKDQGVYSLRKDQWLQIPGECGEAYIKDPLVQQKVEHYMNTIDQIIDSKMGEDAIDALKEKFKVMRSAGISRFGEYSRENLVFKELRNRGYLEKMTKYEKGLQDQQLSLE